MSGRIPFTLNSMVLLPLLRSLPAAAVASIVATLISMLGMDFGLLRLGRPDTAADQLVALMMAFSVSAPSFWAVFLCLNFWEWAVGFVRHYQNRRQNSDA
ncbi:MAG: hypothetical protein U0Q11_01445 [Vicinamibacterales bacterium]